MQITEIFRSIQGESTYAGLPCIFVRLTGCNLRCVWCDTTYSFHGGSRMSLDDVLQQVRELSDKNGKRVVNLVELTGGEPLLQKEIYALIDRLLEQHYEVLIETSGERFIGEVPTEVVRVVDVKCPDSGEGGTFDMNNLGALSATDQCKFVIASRKDYEWARGFVGGHHLEDKVAAVIFSPVFDSQPAQALAEWILEDGLAVRMGMQLHKFIWDPMARGV